MREANACHYPAKSTTGAKPGTFAPKGVCGGGRPLAVAGLPTVTDADVEHVFPAEGTPYDALSPRERLRKIAVDLVAGVNVERVDITADNRHGGTITFTYTSKPSTPGARHTRMERAFRRSESGALLVDHDYCRFESQSGGQAKRMLSAHMAVYKALGVSKLEMYANLDVGGYAWARAGFLPTVESMRSLAVPLTDRIRALRRAGVLTQDEGLQLGSVLHWSNPASLWTLADLRFRRSTPALMKAIEHPTVTSMVGETTMAIMRKEAEVGILNVGRLLLVGQEWIGTFQLGHPLQQPRMDQYLKAPATSAPEGKRTAALFKTVPASPTAPLLPLTRRPFTLRRPA